MYFCGCKVTTIIVNVLAMNSKNDEIRKDSIALRDFLNRFSNHRKTYVIDRICDGCLVPRHTVFNWARGLSRIPELHKRKIEEIFSERIFDSLTICEK